MGAQGECRCFSRLCRNGTERSQSLTGVKTAKGRENDQGFCVGTLARKGKARKVCVIEGGGRIKFKSNCF